MCITLTFFLESRPTGGLPAPLISCPLPPVAVLTRSLELIDEGETDHKIIALRAKDPNAANINNMQDLEKFKPGTTDRLVDWLKNYKTSDGKPQNSLAKVMKCLSSLSIDSTRDANLR